MFDWGGYINTTKNKPPRRLLVRAIKDIKNKETALDLGAGALNDSKYLLEQGFKQVIAVDIEENLELFNNIDKRHFSFKKVAIENYDFLPNTFDLINAQFVLPFLPREKIVSVIDNIKHSLKIDGIFVGQFFGINDSWNKKPAVYVYTKQKIEEFLFNLDIAYFQEEEKDDKTAMGAEKHWHIFNFIAKKH